MLEMLPRASSVGTRSVTGGVMMDDDAPLGTNDRMATAVRNPLRRRSCSTAANSVWFMLLLLLWARHPPP